MTTDFLNKMRLLFRDAYNGRDVTKGGGSRESDDYRSLHFTQLAAPMVFIAEAVEDETAILERVVLLTIVRPAASIAMKWLQRFQDFRRNKEHLSILGLYFGSWIINRGSIAGFQTEFDTLYEGACKKFLVTEKDLAGGISEEALRVKQNAKERSVYNHTVALFGFQQFRKTVNSILDNELDSVMAELEAGIYDRMGDLTTVTMPEYLKVLSMFSTMSHHVDGDRPEALRENFEYASGNVGGVDTLEVSIRVCYLRYRTYCRSSGTPPLFASHEAFAYAIKDSPAMLSMGLGKILQTPGIATFNMEDLSRMGVEHFK